MCQLTAYIVKGEEQEPLLEDVTVVEVRGKHPQLSTRFGASREAEGSIQLLQSNTLFIDPGHVRPSEPARDDAQKLAVLLDHWVEHNVEHNGELERWARKAAALGKSEAHEEMMSAAASVEEANRRLRRAAASLEAPSSE